MLADIGYPKAEILSEAKVNKRSNWVKVKFEIDPGLKYTFGEIEYIGLSRIDQSLLEREVRYDQGDVFSLSKISESQSRIFKLGFFRSVIINTQFDDELLNVKTIYNVVERKLGTVRVGAGFGTEDKLRGQILLNKRNFFGGGRNLEISGKFSFITQKIQTKIIQPYIFGEGSESSVLFNIERDDFPSFRGNSLNSNISFSKEIAKYVSVFASGGLNFSKINSQAKRTPIEESQDNVFLTLLDFGIKYNNTDDFIDPTSGIFSSLLFESSSKSLGSDVNYFKSLFEFRAYKKLTWFILAKRFQLGSIQTFGTSDKFDVPIFKRFFAGGSTSMRGFSFQKLGPLDDSEDPLGGNSVLVGNLEARFPVYKDIGGVVFFDYGNVYINSFDYDLTDLRYAVGTGFRYNTIVGPIRADFGYTLNPNKELRRFQIFISIGQAF
ncbi:MAG: BamA/TamA family outer membrane protein [Candidatus Dadabacteria bacterium]|nr:BamA/TamA family outer membrane protein [Candidatus Dadabacteria bacterium]NIQ13055.1 BamA/TamA family outer membrane protein [Candidatus Dadabacteria bacterium]